MEEAVQLNIGFLGPEMTYYLCRYDHLFMLEKLARFKFYLHKNILVPPIQLHKFCHSFLVLGLNIKIPLT